MDATLPLSRPPSPALRPERGRAVQRTRLVRRLARAEPDTVLLLRAPAGYGKTTLLAQWAAAESRPCAWVTVGDHATADGADATAVVAAIARALDAIDPLPAALRAGLTASRAPDLAPLDTLAAALTAPRRPFALVLDDVHLLRDAVAAPLLELLAACLRGDAGLALAARTEPPLPLARLAAAGRLLELRAAQLALDDGEARELLARTDSALSARDVTELTSCAEGWPAGLVLAAQATAERRCQRDDAPPSAGGADRLVADYVREQLLAGLALTTRDLLVRSAPLGRLSGELCDAVLARSGSGLVLRELAHGNVPLAALDRDERRFRLHPLVAGALLTELRQTNPAWEPEAHRRASAWCERHGDGDGAIDHAVAAGDAGRAGSLAWAALPAHALGAAPERLDRWLVTFGEDRVGSVPSLALAASLRRLAAGRTADAARLVATAQRCAGDLPDVAGCPPVAGLALAYAALGLDGAGRLQADAEAALDAGIALRSWRALALLLAGTGSALLARPELAHEQLADGAWHASSVPLVEALCVAQLALLALDRGDAQRATVLLRRAFACMERSGCAREPLFALVPAVAAFAHVQCGALDEARAALADAQRLLSSDVDLPPWHEAQLRFALARTLLRLADAASARSQLTRMSRALRRMPDAPVPQAWIADAWARADAFAASAVRGPARLTLAELRVLRLLPSHFSLREIAARLEVSANTVKTQAQAVYRKLDVSSRSQAVARAREIGLVDSSRLGT